MKDQIGFELNGVDDQSDPKAPCECCERIVAWSETVTAGSLEEWKKSIVEYGTVYCDPCNTDQCSQGGYYPFCTYNEREYQEWCRDMDEMIAAERERS
jgi:hypothetical protein